MTEPHQPETRGIALAPGTGATVRNPVGGNITLKLRGEDSNGTLAAWEAVTVAGEGPPLHVHVDVDEVVYVLDGSFRVKLDGAVQNAAPGAFIFIPRGVPHTWQNMGDGPGRVFFIVAPAGFETFFNRFAELPDDASVAEKFRTLASEVDMEVVGPPLAESDPI